MSNIIEVKDVSIKFNLCREKVDSIKEYLIKLIKGKKDLFDPRIRISLLHTCYADGIDGDRHYRVGRCSRDL